MAKLSFLADMNISPLTVKQLRQEGWAIWRVSELLDERTSDIEILRYAREHQQIIITQDLDFSSLLALNGFDKPSVISFRVEEPQSAYITKRTMEVVVALENELAAGIIVSVDETSVRYRELPIQITSRN
jgi:predicted nuclease of predicted toxin-antitoxin system